MNYNEAQIKYLRHLVAQTLTNTCEGCGNETDLCICEELVYYEEHGGVEAASSDIGTHGEGYC